MAQGPPLFTQNQNPHEQTRCELPIPGGNQGWWFCGRSCSVPDSRPLPLCSVSEIERDLGRDHGVKPRFGSSACGHRNSDHLNPAPSLQAPTATHLVWVIVPACGRPPQPRLLWGHRHLRLPDHPIPSPHPEPGASSELPGPCGASLSLTQLCCHSRPEAHSLPGPRPQAQ